MAWEAELPWKAWKQVAARMSRPSEDAARMQYKRAVDRLKAMVAGDSTGNMA
ncbi:MAG: hypothetical protein H6832_17525 [Planctomycetes bacterium]|nr:hypothetical protein [Planctomycetota bacterium]